MFCGVRLESKLGSAKADKEDALLVQAEYSLIYEVDGERPSDDLALHFAGANAVFNVWPYFRELVQSTACRMGVPQLVIPSLTIPVKTP